MLIAALATLSLASLADPVFRATMALAGTQRVVLAAHRRIEPLALGAPALRVLAPVHALAGIMLLRG
jgi:hypothetical protein